ncbi:MAG: PEP-CTERM sorting domain-containing protein [Oryzomonas sp.]|uniref:PEP-CTERM sorting domain-containing protein n=1 Tax=Oryzomonas sp. TaxID=2855186 RepID=UPI002850EE10|nr:PEP-CTERM sorting domain-containing protein [Oryzomonas sp.]MDR3578503.1 PEP-CTERM sorting domain-containing protein [Oryzomonas sp.]
MKKRMATLLAVAMLTMATSSMALSIPPGTFTEGAVTFSNFTFVLTNNGNSTPTSLSGVAITPEFLGANPGFAINGGFSAQGLGSDVDLIVKYTATSTSLISDVDLAFDGSVLTQKALASVTEDVYTDSSLSTLLGQIKVKTPSPLSNDINLSTPEYSVYVTKDINLDALSCGGTVTLSDIDQAFSLNTPIPTPEPGTMVLLGIGMLGLAVCGKRRMNKET